MVILAPPKSEFGTPYRIVTQFLVAPVPRYITVTVDFVRQANEATKSNIEF